MSSTPATSSGASASSTLSIPQTAAAGSLTITQPPQSSTSYFKIASGELVTFGWNYTDVLVTPSALTVSAICDNGNTYGVGTVPGTATQIVWDIYSYQLAHVQTPLAPATYTLTVWDERGPDSTRQGGYMEPNSGLKFALYTPQAYTPLSSGWQCTACNRASDPLAANTALLAVLTTFFLVLLGGVRVFRGVH